jgi:Pyruvate/2-oxoacid:ferredoxin oxidoreductase gamma subunit
MMILGSYLAQKKILNIKTVLKVMEEIAPADKRDLIEINQKALREGYKLDDKS